MDIIFGCEKTDKEFPVLINNEFVNTEEAESYGFSGMEDMVIIIVPLVALSVQVIDFIMTHISKDKPKSKGRVVIVKGKKYTFDGYTKDEIIDILKELD